jgi:hypothetical protein
MKLGKWLGLAVAAVVLAEGIWGVLVALTRSLLLPLLARVLGGDPHSPFYLGTGDVNVPDLFAAVLQLCLAGMVFLAIKLWAGRADEVRSVAVKRVAEQPARVKPVTPAKPEPVVAESAPVVAQSAAVIAQPEPVRADAPQVAQVPPVQAKAVPERKVVPEKPAKPQKPRKPQEVYYNIVGEPINPTENE